MQRWVFVIWKRASSRTRPCKMMLDVRVKEEEGTHRHRGPWQIKLFGGPWAPNELLRARLGFKAYGEASSYPGEVSDFSSLSSLSSLPCRVYDLVSDSHESD
jgi:hypothetical protein